MNIVDCLLLLASTFVVKVSSNICFRLHPDSVKHAFTFFQIFWKAGGQSDWLHRLKKASKNIPKMTFLRGFLDGRNSKFLPWSRSPMLQTLRKQWAPSSFASLFGRLPCQRLPALERILAWWSLVFFMWVFVSQPGGVLGMIALLFAWY